MTQASFLTSLGPSCHIDQVEDNNSLPHGVCVDLEITHVIYLEKYLAHGKYYVRVYASAHYYFLAQLIYQQALQPYAQHLAR